MGFGTQVLGFGGFGTRTTYTVASGGNGSESDGSDIDGNYKYHTFTSSGTFTVSSVGTDNTVEYLVIAGGGGSGGGAGGGGAGGYLTATGQAVSDTHGGDGQYAITVGAGGTQGNWTEDGGKGADSVFESVVTAEGGGYGAFNSNAGDGGSGGGGGYNGYSGGSATAGQGNDGGDGFSGGVPPSYPGGGGGGAGGSGGNASYAGFGGDGGAGLNSSITGSSVGRGGGGAGNSRTIGRDGSSSHGAVSNGTATANTGAGAFGNYGFPGASGVVIIRYKFQ